MTSREEFLQKLRATFKIEATEGISKITSNLIGLEKRPDDALKSELIEAVFREAHSLKGAARAVNFMEIESICQSLESVFSDIKGNRIAMASGLFDVFHSAVDLIKDLLNEPPDNPGEIVGRRVAETLSALSGFYKSAPKDPDPVEKQSVERNSDLTEPAQDSMLPPKKETPAAGAKPIVGAADPTVRISIEKLDNLFNQVEDMLTLKQTFVHLNDKLNETSRGLDSWTHTTSEAASVLMGWKQRAEHSKDQKALSFAIADVNRVVQFVESATSYFRLLESDLAGIRKLTLEETHNSRIKIESLLDEVKEIISMPFSTILDVFPKAARDISHNIGKDVIVEVKGGSMEIDRRILEELRIPLMHLLRNCIDHGIESPKIRQLTNKPETGTILIGVDRFENNRAVITFSDDGAGIDFFKVRQKYAKYHNLSAAEVEETEEQTLIDFLFNSGVTTSDMITELSGRGLGLTIVREKINQMGGSMTVKSQKGKGTEFRIEVPLSLVTVRGIQIRTGEREFIVPTTKVDRVLRLDKSEYKTIGRKASIKYEDRIIPLVYLSDLLEIPNKENESANFVVLVMGSIENRMGFAVDEIVDEEMVLVKKFNRQLKRVRNIAGATVLGSGKVVPILNVADLLKSAMREGHPGVAERAINPVHPDLSVLVVEDSITSRMLLKNILESSGYRVYTAVDGIDGYTSLKVNPVDLVVSDVDMPRMNGLDMTAKIRSDSALSGIPIVLVTSLSKREDRERGLEVGANAYIVKSNFDQSNLLEVIEKLIGK